MYNKKKERYETKSFQQSHLMLNFIYNLHKLFFTPLGIYRLSGRYKLFE